MDEINTMRLLRFDDRAELSLTRNLEGNLPPYAILSHTWRSDEDEVNFDDLKYPSYKKKAGYAKIHFCGEQAKKDSLEYFWVDTCCINKSAETELSESIRSMFRWYERAATCYVCLSDVNYSQNQSIGGDVAWEVSFRRSRWFHRGWTLQELLAPATVKFFSQEGEYLGDKWSLVQLIHETTSIPLTALKGVSPLLHFSIEERIAWIADRDTKRKEDKAYSLQGILGVNISPRYGEGEVSAFHRLTQKINKPHGKGCRNPKFVS